MRTTGSKDSQPQPHTAPSVVNNTRPKAQKPSPAPPTESLSEMELARKDIRAAGFRATPARIATLLELRSSSSPMTHADVADRLAGGGFDKATAFRNLNDLAQGGLLRRTELGDHVWRFEAIGPDEHDKQAHPHFVCIDCGQVTCLSDIDLNTDSGLQSQSVGEITEILLRGHCIQCR
ncbi:MAG: transcriptional repressor [Planctomycetaceae bacterium]|nr:MAG: transcriptional repressor [Planctomycetaceae bacterium]